MEKVVLEEMKEKMQFLQQTVEEYKNISSQMQSLQKTYEVGKYLELNEQLHTYLYRWLQKEENIQFLQEMSNQIANFHLSNSFTKNGIYMYIGTFYDLPKMGARHYLVSSKYSSAEYSEYQNLETQHIISLPIEICTTFENIYRIVFPQYISRNYLFSIQSEFYRLANAQGTEHATQKILQKYNTNVKI